MRHALLWTLLLCLTTAVVTSAGAAGPDTTIRLETRTEHAKAATVTTLHIPLVVWVWVSNIEADASITVQFKECGLNPPRFQDVWVLPPYRAGDWSAATPVESPANGTFRATIDPNVVSNEVSVQTRAFVRLAPTTLGHYRTVVEARQSFWRKRVRIERYDRGQSKWLLLRTVAMDHTEPYETGYPSLTYIRSSSDEFALKLPARTKLRAVFPLSQAKPCYAAGTSKVLQT